MTLTTTARRTLPLVALLAIALTGLAQAQDTQGKETPGQHVPPTNWNDTFVGARYSNNFHFPGSAAKVTQAIGTLTTTGGFRYGSYYFNVDYLVSDHNNPEAGGTHGAQETYSVGHVEWSGGKLLGRRLAFGPVRDLALTTGYEWGTKNDAFEERARMWMLGATAEFAVPQGYWNLTLGARRELNYNGISRQDVDFDTAWHVDSSWAIPFNAGPAPLVFKGFAALTGPKGYDGFHVKTKTETLVRTSLLLDVGSFAGHPRSVYVGPGYEYWDNMFGTPSFEAPGTHRSAAVLVGEAHF